MKANKVKFNIKNVHFAVLTEAADGIITWGTPVKIPGAVSIGLDANGEITPFYADGITYYQSASNAGYEGDLEMALIPDEFRVAVLKEELDTKKVLFENANVETGAFALLFEFDGDVKATRHCLYNCVSTRPTIESKTIEDKKEPGTEKLTITASPLPDEKGTVKGKSTPETDAAVYDAWYSAVYNRTTA